MVRVAQLTDPPEAPGSGDEAADTLETIDMMVFTRSFHRAEMIMAAVHQRGTVHLLMGQLSCIWLMMLIYVNDSLCNAQSCSPDIAPPSFLAHLLWSAHRKDTRCYSHTMCAEGATNGTFHIQVKMTHRMLK